ncbi:hypothetical protein, partial [Aeromonas caviae]
QAGKWDQETIVSFFLCQYCSGEYLPFYRVAAEAVDSRLRNGIAHYKYEYTESTQLIKIYPTKEGLERKNFDEIYFLEFMRKILMLFREVHNINHMIKAIHYYCIFIFKIEV